MSKPFAFGLGSVGLANDQEAVIEQEKGAGIVAVRNKPRKFDTGSSIGREAVPAAVMKRAHMEKLQLCDALERIADSLPSVDRLKCLGTANAIVPLLRNIHQYEETVIFPAYEAALSGSDPSAASIRRLRAEHIEDECYASEVTEILLAIGHGEAIENAEAVGFMLRSFFESMRRHIAFEREHVLPTIGMVG